MTTQGCHPCRVCGATPELIEVSYGRGHNDIACPKGCQRIEVDGSERACRKAWNLLNPAKKDTHAH